MFEEEPELDDLTDFDTGIRVVTISVTNDGEVPELDLGGLSVYTVATVLRAALDSLDILIPPVNISTHGEILVSHSIPDEEVEFETGLDEEED